MSDEPQMVALVLSGSPTPRLMPVDEAKDMYARLEAKREANEQLTQKELNFHAALTLSLGTMFDLERVKRDWIAAGGEWK